MISEKKKKEKIHLQESENLKTNLIILPKPLRNSPGKCDRVIDDPLLFTNIGQVCEKIEMFQGQMLLTFKPPNAIKTVVKINED